MPHGMIFILRIVRPLFLSLHNCRIHFLFLLCLFHCSLRMGASRLLLPVLPYFHLNCIITIGISPYISILKNNMKFCENIIIMVMNQSLDICQVFNLYAEYVFMSLKVKCSTIKVNYQALNNG